jgi:hypothetical protein
MSASITVSALPPQEAQELVAHAQRFCDATDGVRSENLQRGIAGYEAALALFTHASYPAPWALIQNNLGAAYEELQTGDRAENLRNAIFDRSAVLRIHGMLAPFRRFEEG